MTDLDPALIEQAARAMEAHRRYDGGEIGVDCECGETFREFPAYDAHDQHVARAVLEAVALFAWPERPALAEVDRERISQDAKWGEQNHPDGTGPTIPTLNAADRARHECDYAHRNGTGTWRHILEEEVAEALAESDPVRLREELIQVAAVAVSWIEAIDRRTTLTKETL